MKPQFPRADHAALAAFDPRTKSCTMNCGPSLDDPRSPEERRFLCPDCETVESHKIDPAHTPAARAMWIVNFPDGDSYDLALNAARHMAEWTAIEAAQAGCDDPHSPLCNAMRKRSAQYAWVARILEGDADPTVPAAESHLLRRVRSLKVLLGVDSPETRGWAPAVQQEALRVVHEVIALLAGGFAPPRVEDAAADDKATHLETLDLRSFYNVRSLTELVRAQAQQIEKLSAQTSTNFDWANRQLPAGITREDVCIWTQDSDGPWSTSCGVTWEFNDGGPAENSAHFCHHCGGVLLSSPFE